MSVTARNLDDWSDRLSRLIGEMSDAYGGRLPSKLENLTLYAWQEAREERERIDRLAEFESVNG